MQAELGPLGNFPLALTRRPWQVPRVPFPGGKLRPPDPGVTREPSLCYTGAVCCCSLSSPLACISCWLLQRESGGGKMLIDLLCEALLR